MAHESDGRYATMAHKCDGRCVSMAHKCDGRFVSMALKCCLKNLPTHRAEAKFHEKGYA